MLVRRLDNIIVSNCNCNCVLLLTEHAVQTCFKMSCRIRLTLEMVTLHRPHHDLSQLWSEHLSRILNQMMTPGLMGMCESERQENFVRKVSQYQTNRSSLSSSDSNCLLKIQLQLEFILTFLGLQYMKSPTSTLAKSLSLQHQTSANKVHSCLGCLHRLKQPLTLRGAPSHWCEK